MSENQFDALETMFEIQCSTRNQMRRRLKRHTQRSFMKCVKQTHVTLVNMHLDLISLNCCIWISDPMEYAVEKREFTSFEIFRLDFFSICEWHV